MISHSLRLVDQARCLVEPMDVVVLLKKTLLKEWGADLYTLEDTGILLEYFYDGEKIMYSRLAYNTDKRIHERLYTTICPVRPEDACLWEAAQLLENRLIP